MEAILLDMVPVVLLLAIGYSLKRWVGAGAGALDDVVRFVLVPAFVFKQLQGPIGSRTVMITLGVAVAVALVAHLLVRYSSRIFKRQVDTSASVYDILLFTAPVLLFGWGLRRGGLMILVVMFVGMAVTTIIARQGEKSFGALVRQPWLYAAAAGLIVSLTGLSTKWVDPTVGHIARATPALLLLVVGTRLHPFVSAWKRGDVWLATLVHYVPAAGIAALALYFLPVPDALGPVVLAAALAPAATESAAMVRGGKGAGNGIATVGVVLSLLAVVAVRYLT